MKKTLTIVLAAVMMSTLFVGCSTTNNQATTKKSDELVTIKFLEPGDKPKDYDTVAKKINDKLKADGTGIQLEREYIPWDAWAQKTNLKLSTGEEFDILPVMQDLTPFSVYYAKGALADITSAVEKYGSNIKKNVPKDLLDAAKVDGKMVTIPTYWLELASEGEFDIRLDLLKQNNLEIPKTPDDLLNDLQIVQKNWKGSKKLYLTTLPSYDPLSVHTTALHRTYDSFPFTVKDKLFYVNQTGDLKSWIETPEFKQDAAFMRKAYTMGLINPDVLTYKNDQQTSDINNGSWFLSFGTAGNLPSLKKNNPDATNNDVQAIYFNTEKPYLRPIAFKNCVSISSTSKHPEEAIKFINWLWANQDNYDLYFYGIDGTHFKKDGDHGIISIPDPANNNQPTYTDSDWMAGNINFIRTDNVNGLPSNNKFLYSPNTKAENSVASSFIFDPTNVKAEYANIQTEAAASITPIYMGVLDYSKAFPVALQKMKAAGLDKVVAEYQKQYTAFKAKNGK